MSDRLGNLSIQPYLAVSMEVTVGPRERARYERSLGMGAPIVPQVDTFVKYRCCVCNHKFRVRFDVARARPVAFGCPSRACEDRMGQRR